MHVTWGWGLLQTHTFLHLVFRLESKTYQLIVDERFIKTQNFELGLGKNFLLDQDVIQWRICTVNAK